MPPPHDAHSIHPPHSQPGLRLRSSRNLTRDFGGVCCGMRPPRLLAAPGCSGLYHVTSRVVDKRIIFSEKERARFLKLAKGYAEFGGIDLVSWCLMGNHFHLMVRVRAEDPALLADEAVLERCSHIYEGWKLEQLRVNYANSPSEAGRRQLLDPFRERMASLPEYVGQVKKAFTLWYNFRNNRCGTLWEGRYHSTLMEHEEDESRAKECGLGGLARKIAAYIDLNPLRAGEVSEPEGNDWTGYGRALRGDPVALHGLRMLWGDEAGGKDQLLSVHRCAVYEEGHEDKVPEGGPKAKRRGIAREKVLRVRQEWSKARALGSARFVAGIQGGQEFVIPSSA